MENLFKAKLKGVRASDNRFGTALSYRYYNTVIDRILMSKLNKSQKSMCEPLLLEKFEVIQEEETKRLIVPNSDPRLYYVHDDELFSVLMETHMATGHGNRIQMMTQLRKTYKNIVYQDVLIFLSLCKECSQSSLSLSQKAERTTQFNRQCLIEIIDYHVSPDGEYNFILVYKELSTRFVMLKPLKSKKPEEVADNLINIFGILAPPLLLQSTCTAKFLDRVIEMLKILWPSLDIGSMKSEGAMDSSAVDIQSMIIGWMRNNNNSRWSEGIRFVQLKNNTTFNKEIKTTPYEALFKHSVKVGTETGANKMDQDTSDEHEVSVKEEPMEICKTELKSGCANCGNEVEDDGECDFCKSGEIGSH